MDYPPPVIPNRPWIEDEDEMEGYYADLGPDEIDWQRFLDKFISNKEDFLVMKYNPATGFFVCQSRQHT